MHDVGLIATIAAAFGLALVLGLLVRRVGMPPLVGYLLAGVAIGPATPGFVGDVGLSRQLAEIGVMLLMFGVGLHFSVKDLMEVKRIAVPGAIVQIVVATLLGAGVAHLFGAPLGEALLLGLSLSVASTVVLLRGLETVGLLSSIQGKIAVGWLVVEDLVMVLVLVLLPVVVGAGGASDSSGFVWAVGGTLVKVVGFIAFMMLVARRALTWLLQRVAATGSNELFTLAVVASAVSVAFGAAELFGVSFALGAFFAGMVMRESEYSHRAAHDSLPLRDAFSVLFFVSVGMLFEPDVLWTSTTQVIAVVAVIMVGKSLAAVAIVLLFGYPVATALTVAAGLAQIGEFSFILTSLGVEIGILSRHVQSLVLAGAIVSIALNAFVFGSIGPVSRRLIAWFPALKRGEGATEVRAVLPAPDATRNAEGAVLIAGGGRVGTGVAAAVTAAGKAITIIDANRERAASFAEHGWRAVAGDAGDPATWAASGLDRASAVVVAIPDVVTARRAVTVVRALRADVPVVVRVHGDEQAALFVDDGVGVFHGDQELARGMAARVLADLRGVPT